MYTYKEPKDRIIISFCCFILTSLILRTVIVSGTGGSHKWRMRSREYLLSDIQNLVCNVLVFVLIVLTLIVIYSVVEMVIDWFRRHNSI